MLPKKCWEGGGFFLARLYAASGALKRRVALAGSLWLEQGQQIYAIIRWSGRVTP
jgi:hypothetical protein